MANGADNLSTERELQEHLEEQLATLDGVNAALADEFDAELLEVCNLTSSPPYMHARTHACTQSHLIHSILKSAPSADEEGALTGCF